MDTFLSTLLGAALATFGGIIASYISFNLSKKNALHENKKNAYLNLLTCCEKLASLKTVNSLVDNKETLVNEITTAKSYILLYGSIETIKAYTKFYKTITDERNNPNFKSILDKQISTLVAAMKCDLGIANKKERNIVKMLQKGGANNAD